MCLSPLTAIVLKALFYFHNHIWDGNLCLEFTQPQQPARVREKKNIASCFVCACKDDLSCVSKREERDIFPSLKSKITPKCCMLLLVILYQFAAPLVNLFWIKSDLDKAAFRRFEQPDVLSLKASVQGTEV